MTRASNRKQRRANRKGWRRRGGSGHRRMKGSRLPASGGGGASAGTPGAIQKAPAWVQAAIGVIVIGLVVGTVAIVLIGIFG
ncbi:MAG: hypothetical protein AAFX76_05780 [Planctomycetota bacterium]